LKREAKSFVYVDVAVGRPPRQWAEVPASFFQRKGLSGTSWVGCTAAIGRHECAGRGCGRRARRYQDGAVSRLRMDAHYGAGRYHQAKPVNHGRDPAL
jgi:hypothetical protein